MSPSVVEGLKVLTSASYLMPWLDTANTAHVAAAWLTSLQALAAGSMTPEQVMDQVKQAIKKAGFTVSEVQAAPTP